MTGARLGALPGVSAALARVRAQLEAQPDLSSAALAEQGKLRLTDHGLVRVRQRVFNGIECQVAEPWRVVFRLWDVGQKTPWHDPDDRPGYITVTSLSDRGSIVGRREIDTGRIWIVSALTPRQHANNARVRWRRAEDRFLR